MNLFPRRPNQPSPAITDFAQQVLRMEQQMSQFTDALIAKFEALSELFSTKLHFLLAENVKLRAENSALRTQIAAFPAPAATEDELTALGARIDRIAADISAATETSTASVPV